MGDRAKTYGHQGRLKGGANRAIARGPRFWGAHELFEKFFFYYLYEKKKCLNYFSYILLILIQNIKII